VLSEDLSSLSLGQKFSDFLGLFSLLLLKRLFNFSLSFKLLLGGFSLLLC